MCLWKKLSQPNTNIYVPNILHTTETKYLLNFKSVMQKNKYIEIWFEVFFFTKNKNKLN